MQENSTIHPPTSTDKFAPNCNYAASVVSNTLKRALTNSKGENVYCAAYLAYFIKSADTSFDSLADAAAAAAGNDELVAQALTSTIEVLDTQTFFSALKKLSVDDLHTFLEVGSALENFMQHDISTPYSIASLVIRILNIKKDDRVVDFGSGFGEFLQLAESESGAKKLLGIESNKIYTASASIRAKVTGTNISYLRGDMFACYEAFLASNKANKTFSNYPWGMRIKNLESKSDYLEQLKQEISQYGNPSSADWLFNRLLVDSITQDGIAVGIMTNGSAVNGADAAIREYFIKSGWIQAAISLPAGVFAPMSQIPSTLVVFSHGNTQHVRLVDATDLGTKGRRCTTLSDADVQTILTRLSTTTEKSIQASIANLAQHEYTLSASRLLQKELKLNHPVPLENVVESITRGAGLRARELDSLSCTEDTGICYLNLANIVDGAIEGELPYLKELDSKQEKCCLESGDLLISKSGAPYKVAVARVPQGQKILANGNVYIIKLNTQKVDPYYVCAFLNSPAGKETLARASKGAVIPTLSLGDLMTMQIPLESQQTQQTIAAFYKAKMEEIAKLKARLNQAREELTTLYPQA